jgi:5'(3')-deoxyribonucleotidase
MRIGVDIDGVLADQTREILQRIGHRTGRRFRRSDVTGWDAILGGIDIEVEIEESLQEDPGYVRRMRLIRGAREASHQLAKKHELVAITNRGEESREATEEWLRSKELPIRRIESTRRSSKSQVNVDVLVDDNPKNIQEFASSGGVGILFTQPWNKSVATASVSGHRPRVYRADNWQEVCSIVSKLSRSLPEG